MDKSAATLFEQLAAISAKGELVTRGMYLASQRGHRMEKAETYPGGAFARCKVCGRHLRVETSRPTVFGSATYRGCSVRIPSPLAGEGGTTVPGEGAAYWRRGRVSAPGDGGGCKG